MSSLTETSLLYCLTDIPENNNDKNNDKLLKDVYLCLQKEGRPNSLNGFNCYKFNNIDSAKKYLKNIKPSKIEKMHTIIQVCKWIPNICHTYILNYKLHNFFWKNDITIIKHMYQKQ